MSQLGERLRQSRERQGLSLAQAAVETRIRQQWLAALEEGNYALFPNDVVTKGFIRNYASLLDVSADELIDLYRQEHGKSEPIRVIPTSSIRPRRSYVLPGFFGVFFVTVALVGLAYISLSAFGYVRDQSSIALRTTTTATVAAPTPTALDVSPTANVAQAGVAGNTDVESSLAEDEEPTPTTAATDRAEDDADSTAQPEPTTAPTTTAGIAGVVPTVRPTPRPTATLEAPIVVEVSILPGTEQGSWLRVNTDGVVVYEQIMGPGEGQVFLAQRQVNIRAGNPTFVQVSVNGLQTETIGQVPGEPVDWSWPPQ
jgi:cytoskeletal protein RodZ